MVSGAFLAQWCALQFRIGSQTITVNHATRPSLMDAVRARFLAGAGFALATINLDHLVKMRRSAQFLAAYGAHDMVVADGNPIVWLSRLARRPVDLLPGSDLVRPLSALAAVCGRSVALVGSTEAALDAAATSLMAEIPGLTVIARHAPAMGFDPEGPEAARILTDLHNCGAGLCFLALGAPKQEIFAARGRHLAPNVGFASIGAGVDFIAGTQARAPKWVRLIAMEWLWRAIASPRRMVPRYAACASVLPAEMVNALSLRHSKA